MSKPIEINPMYMSQVYEVGRRGLWCLIWCPHCGNLVRAAYVLKPGHAKNDRWVLTDHLWDARRTALCKAGSGFGVSPWGITPWPGPQWLRGVAQAVLAGGVPVAPPDAGEGEEGPDTAPDTPPPVL